MGIQTDLVGGARTIFKNIKSMVGGLSHDYPIYEMENNPFMFETTNQISYNGHTKSIKILWIDDHQNLSSDS